MEMVEAQSLVPAPRPATPRGASLIKQLASCNKSTRDKALRLLNKWLPSQLEISDDDMKKVWKGLFYCVWHADKSIPQSDLINGLSSLLLALDLPLSVQYFSVFLLTIRREWPGIDAVRLDKFYLMIRRFFRCFFLLLKNNNWNLDLTTRLMKILEERAFFADDMIQGGNGVNYHIASVFIEELKPFLPVDVETLDVIFKPLLSVMCKSQDRVLIGKIKFNVFDLLLRNGKTLLERKKKQEGDEDQELVNLGTIALVMGFSAKFFDLGSSPDCYQGNRKVLYGLHEEFVKLEKDLESSGIEIERPLFKVKDDEDVPPELIPIVSAETEMSADTTKASKKKKKKDKKVNDDEDVPPELIPIDNAETETSADTTKASKKKKKVAKKGSSDRRRIKEDDGSEKENVKAITSNGAGSIGEPTTSNGDIITFNESVISNLQMQFEKVAAEIGLLEENGVDGDDDTPKIAVISKKKRKRGNSKDNNIKNSVEADVGEKSSTATSGKSAKKVRFSIKNNLVWKPQSPLPPESLRIPPSSTPRGSALKKGLPPGPVREIKQKPLMKKKTKIGGVKQLWQ